MANGHSKFHAHELFPASAHSFDTFCPFCPFARPLLRLSQLQWKDSPETSRPNGGHSSRQGSWDSFRGVHSVPSKQSRPMAPMTANNTFYRRFEHWFVQFWQVMAIGERRWTCRNGFSWKFCAEPQIWRWNGDRGLVLKPDGKGCFYLPKVQGWIGCAVSARPRSRAAGTAQPRDDLQTGHSLAEKKIGEVRLRWSKHRDGRTMKIPYAPLDKLEHEFIWFYH